MLTVSGCRTEWKPPPTDDLPEVKPPPSLKENGSHTIIVSVLANKGDTGGAMPPDAHVRDAVLKRLKEAGFTVRPPGASVGPDGYRFVLQVQHEFTLVDRETVRVKGDWKLTDNTLGRVTFLTYTRGLSTVKPLMRAAQMAVVKSVRELAGNESFLRQVVRSDEAVKAQQSVAKAASVTLGRCERVAGRKLPRDMDKVMASVVAIQVGDRLGAGAVISPDGYVLTAAHVVGLSGRIKVAFKSGRSFEAKRVVVQGRSDVALLKLPGDGHPCVAGVEKRPPSGAEVFGIGMPAGLKFSVSKGVISGYRKLLGMDLVQTDTSLNPGNSGGPLLTDGGELAGVVSWKLGKAEGLSFAVPYDAAMHALHVVRKGADGKK